jgi:inorganic pyrophosphatase
LIGNLKKGVSRVVQSLPYPANYGMIPQTLSPEEIGGDGDPLDVLLLGEAVPRGAYVKGKLIRVMYMKNR